MHSNSDSNKDANVYVHYNGTANVRARPFVIRIENNVMRPSTIKLIDVPEPHIRLKRQLTVSNTQPGS